MQFIHPEVLYALFLLLIPIIIHLFQLRRFQRIDFTNVAFLKKVTIQTRKSSQLKKWLTLLFRLLAVACIVIAFAQPFSASKSALNAEKETVLYIDNSFSMQAKGANGPLLKRSLQQLYDQINGDSRLSWFTNSETKPNVSVQDFKSEILSTPYSQNQLTPQEVILKAQQLFTNSKSSNKRLLYVSDLQLLNELPEVPEDFELEVVQTKPVAITNISIDTAYINAKTSAAAQLSVRISKQGNSIDNVPVSLYKGNTLVAKISADLSGSNTTLVQFDIEADKGFNGRLEINDSNLLYDNSLYFNINIPKRIKILSINEAKPDYINRLFNQSEFEYNQQSSTNLNYNDIPDQNFIILNELNRIPSALSAALLAFVEDGGSLLLVPSQNSDLQSYNTLLNGLQLGSMNAQQFQEKKISKIVFEHPLYVSVFEKKVINFQYPKVNAFYPLNSAATSVLRFEDNSPFLLQRNKIFLCTAPINLENSNFQSSPLIVPTFYNMAIQSLPLPKLYYENGKESTFAIPLSLGQDEILTLNDSISNFIPLQQSKANQVIITTLDQPETSGTYEVRMQSEFIEYVSYNYNRRESKLQYADADNWEGVRSYDEISAMFETITEENSINSYWKWFVIFALLFLIIEMLVLKFYKN